MVSGRPRTRTGAGNWNCWSCFSRSRIQNQNRRSCFWGTQTGARTALPCVIVLNEFHRQKDSFITLIFHSLLFNRKRSNRFSHEPQREIACVDWACADCPGFWSRVLLVPHLPSLIQSLTLPPPWTCFHGPFEQILGSAAPCFFAYLALISARKNNKPNFLWPNMPRLGPENPPKKVYVGPFLRPFPGKEAHTFFFWGSKMGRFRWAPKSLRYKNLCVFFCPLTHRKP